MDEIQMIVEMLAAMAQALAENTEIPAAMAKYTRNLVNAYEAEGFSHEEAMTFAVEAAKSVKLGN